MGLRCFIAIDFPDEIKSRIGEITGELRRTGADVKWVKTENIHITLKFLGDTPESMIEEIKKTLSGNLSKYGAFYIKITGLGYFPPGRHPRIIWIGLEDSEMLKIIYKAVEDGMGLLGFKPEERGFSPHITIGRVRSNMKMKELIVKMQEMKETFIGNVRVTGAVLMKSDLKPAGPEYGRLAEINFTGREDVW